MQQKEKKPREYRGVSDEIREQHQKTKNMTFKERLAYFGITIKSIRLP